MNKCIYDYTYGILKYPLAVLFLIDYHLTWRHNQKVLRGDFATNISAGLAGVSSVIGLMVHTLGRIRGKR